MIKNNLFPTEETTDDQPDRIFTDQEIKLYGKNPVFDWNTGEFKLSPTGKNVMAKETDGWVEWCQKALATERYKYLAYDGQYGEEVTYLIGRGYPREIAESEIKRRVKECLESDPRTLRVENFSFEWPGDDTVVFICNAVNTLGERAALKGKVV